MPIFNPGVKLLLKAPNTPLEPSPDHPIAYLHFVDGDGNTIVPEYEIDGLRTSAGPVSGAKITVANAADISAINDQISTLRQGGQWATGTADTPLSAPYSMDLVAGVFHRLNLENLGSSDEVTAILPTATAELVGRRIGLAVINAGEIGPGQITLHVTTTGGQAIEGRALPFAPAGYRPRFVFVSVQIVADTTWGWSLESYTVDSAP